jgi:putative permease
MRQLAVLTVIILLTLLLATVAWQLRSVVLMFVFALAIAAALDEPIDLLVERGWSKTLAILTVYGAVLGALVLMIMLVVLPAIRELDPMVQDMLIQYSSMQGGLLEMGEARPRFLSRLPTTEQLAAWMASEDGAGMAQTAVNITRYLGNGLGQAALAIVIAIYWTADQNRFERLWLSLLPPGQRVRARTLLRTLEKDVGAYIRSELLQSIIAGGVLTVAYMAVRVEYPYLLALIVALAWFIPLIGGPIGVLAAALIGTLGGPWVGVAAVVCTIAVLLLMEFWVERRLYTHERYWGVLVVLVMLALGDALGIFGLLIAPPVAVALQIAINGLLDRPATTQPEPVQQELPQLRARLADLQARVAQMEGEPSPRVVNLIERLEKLLADAEKAEQPVSSPRSLVFDQPRTRP